MTDHSALVKSDSDDPRIYLLLSIDSINRQLNFCPYATTLSAYSRVLKSHVISQIKCKRWGCRHCGPRRITSLALRVKEAAPVKFLTLTVDPSAHRSKRAAYDDTRRKVTQLAVKIRRRWGSFEYLRILEITAKGWPHYHLLCRCGYIPQKWLSAEWFKLTGAYIVDIRKIHKRQDVYFYVLKYLSKLKYIPWTDRRVSCSRHFFPPDSKLKGVKLDLRHREFFDEHPSEVLWKFFRTLTVCKFNKDVLMLSEWIDPHNKTKPDPDHLRS